jgi:N-acetylmuramoyl-L-alanine amidase
MRPLSPLPPLPSRCAPPDAVLPPAAHRHRRAARAAATLGAAGLALPAAYTVQPGDTLSEIARDHGTSTSAIAEANGIDDPNRVVAGTRLELPEPEAAGPQAAAHGPSAGSEVGALLEEVATAHGWSPRFVKALAWQESGWNQSQVSSAGAVGIMQVMPGTGEFVSRELVGRDLDLEDPRDNVEAGVVFLQYLWELTDGDAEQTLAGYYQGLRSVAEHGRYDDTERYIANVLALRDRF